MLGKYVTSKNDGTIVHWPCNKNRFIEGTEVPIIFKVYVLRLCKGIYPQNLIMKWPLNSGQFPIKYGFAFSEFEIH
jgi:hypothetical protein